MENFDYLPLYSEILPRLFLGGTDNSDVVHEMRRNGEALVTKRNFDTVITAYAFANPASWGVKELRYGFYDGDMKDIDFETIEHLVDVAYDDWKNKGKKILARCQAGLNRSSFVLCQVLMRDGYTAKSAIALMREKRSPWVLCNAEFEDYLMRLDEPKETSVA
jgi:protein-tyrosine phosphatase